MNNDKNIYFLAWHWGAYSGSLHVTCVEATSGDAAIEQINSRFPGGEEVIRVRRVSTMPYEQYNDLGKIHTIKDDYARETAIEIVRNLAFK